MKRETLTTARTLAQISQIQSKQAGILVREVARLNTREGLIATWFERAKTTPLAFTHEMWRMALKAGETEQAGKALLTLLNSKAVVYLINLFSTNNHVGRDELARLPIPNPSTFPEQPLAALANQLLAVRARLETEFVGKYEVRLPDFEDGAVYVSPAGVLAKGRVSRLRFADLLLRGEVAAPLANQGRIRALHRRNAITCIIPPEVRYAATFARSLFLFLEEMSRLDLSWQDAQNWKLPDPIASGNWLSDYETIVEQAQQNWQRFVDLQRQADTIVADWYGFDADMQAAIAAGLPWARRQRSAQSARSMEQTTEQKTDAAGEVAASE